MDLKEEYKIIQTKINELIDLNKPIEKRLYLRQIEILEQLDEKLENNSPENILDFFTRYRYNLQLKYVAEKLNLPIEKYDENLKILTSKIDGE